MLTFVCLSEGSYLGLHISDPGGHLSGDLVKHLVVDAVLLDDNSATSTSPFLSITTALFHLAAQLLQRAIGYNQENFVPNADILTIC